MCTQKRSTALNSRKCSPSPAGVHRPQRLTCTFMVKNIFLYVHVSEFLAGKMREGSCWQYGSFFKSSKTRSFHHDRNIRNKVRDACCDAWQEAEHSLVSREGKNAAVLRAILPFLACLSEKRR